MVANSPGLIAGSYVLHRLLVPRHPPIALSSLSHNKKLQRCSRPLCSSQNTGRNTNPNHHPPQPASARGEKHPGTNTTPEQFGEGRPQPHHHTNHHPHRAPVGAASDPEKPEQPETPGRPDSSGPNSAPRSLTQPHSRSTHPPPKHRGISSTSSINQDPNLMVNVPQSEAPPPQDRRLRNGE